MVVPSCPLVRGSAPRRAPAAGCGVGRRQVRGCRVPRDQSCGPWRSSHAHETRGVEALARRCTASRRTQASPARCAPAPRASGSRWRGPVRRTMDRTGSTAAGAERRTPARLLEAATAGQLVRCRRSAPVLVMRSAVSCQSGLFHVKHRSCQSDLTDRRNLRSRSMGALDGAQGRPVGLHGWRFGCVAHDNALSPAGRLPLGRRCD